MTSAPTRPWGRAGHSAWVRWRTCGRKRRYSSEFVAINAATVLRWRGLPPMRGYHCPFCDHWHLHRIDHTGLAAASARAGQKGIPA